MWRVNVCCWARCYSRLLLFSAVLCYLASDMLSKGLIQAYEMQDFAHETAMAIREQLKRDGRVSAPDKDTANIIGTLGKVWKDAQEQIRIHRGKPLPGSLTHEKIGKRSSKRSIGSSSMFAAYADSSNDSAQPAQPSELSATVTCPACGTEHLRSNRCETCSV